jgi:hypothetical protein
MSAPKRSYGQRLELGEGISPRGLPYQSANEVGNNCSAPLQICRVALLLLRQRRGAAGSNLGTTPKYLRSTASGAAGNGLGTTGNGLGTTIKYQRRITSGASGNCLGTTIKYLQRATSGAVGSDLGATNK